MSEKYFASRAGARELLYALLYKKDFIALLEPDKTRGGLSHEMEVTGDEPARPCSRASTFGAMGSDRIFCKANATSTNRWILAPPSASASIGRRPKNSR